MYFLFMINPPKAGNIGDGEARSIRKLSIWRAENYVNHIDMQSIFWGFITSQDLEHFDIPL